MQASPNTPGLRSVEGLAASPAPQKCLPWTDPAISMCVLDDTGWHVIDNGRVGSFNETYCLPPRSLYKWQYSHLKYSSRGGRKDKLKEAAVGLIMCSAGVIAFAVCGDHWIFGYVFFSFLYAALCLGYFFLIGEEALDSLEMFLGKVVMLGIIVTFCVPAIVGGVLFVTGIGGGMWDLAILGAIVGFGSIWIGARLGAFCSKLVCRCVSKLLARFPWRKSIKPVASAS